MTIIKKIKLLIIEDKKGNSTLIQGFLSSIKKFEFRVITLSKLKQIIKNLDEFDIIIMDLGVNKKTIIAASKKLTPLVADIPIIIISDLENEQLALSAFKEGIQDYLLKTEVTPNSLARAIHYAIEREKVKQSTCELAAIVENTFDAILSVTTQGIILNWNSAAEQIYHYSAEEIIGQSFQLLFPEERYSEFKKIVQQIEAGAKIINYETILKSKKGNLLNVTLTISPLEAKFNKVTSAAIIIHNITKAKLHEQQLAIQYRVTSALSEAPNLDYAAHNILKTICEIFDWQVGELWALDQQKDELYSVSFWYANENYHELSKINHGKKCTIGKRLPGLIWQLKKPHWIINLKNHAIAEEAKPFIKKGLRSFFGLPIIYNREVIGVIVFFSKFLDIPNINLISVFTNIGSHIGMFIKRKRAESELLYLAEHDVLTGFRNRASLENDLNRAILNTKVQQNMLGVCYIDLDNFKKINDMMGHDYGDLLLKEVANRIRHNVRSLDIISRVGGDEFVIILPEVKQKNDIGLIAQNLLNVLEKPFNLRKKKFHVTASIGIAICPTDGENFTTLIKNADMAMYYAKIHGRNRYQFYAHAIEAFTQQKLTLESNLHKALKKQEFILYYQPQVEVKTGRISGLEALIRWNNGSNQLIYPKQFISLAEESSLMIPIGEWVLHTACYQIKSWKNEGLCKDINIAVNISVQQLDFQFIERLKTILKSTHIKPTYLEIEITETALMGLKDSNIATIKKLKELGVKLSIDDFGIGYSSFVHLKDLMIDVIKIDQFFISQLANDENCQAIVKAIIAMANSLNVKVIAEGVETKEQLKILKKFGCNYYQGYLFSKPLPFDEVYGLLHKQCK
ncbi:inner membrane protein PLUS sensory box protein LssE [Legionella busanensis]|uniref:Inner membrane protein PLUS sensory box protein LssE n=1 Tax=Legionella busanensis TaxID=190655 RepID=A0A378JM67_9GAMM|nr:EAL domain-containing protein [Legionella busanensis]STX52315.1 inner membrane protein PLUS sensory box protein LssE [Legionella busanensis]